MRWRVLLVGVVLLAGACGDAGEPAAGVAAPATTETPRLLPVVRDAGVAYTPSLELDVYRPDAAGPWPVVVLVPGGGWDSAELTSTAGLAEHLAGRGAVVFNATYRLSAPEAFADVACAVRFATESAERYGGNPDRVVLGGHSAGGHVSAVVALSGESFDGDCTATGRYVPPAAWVGIAGAYNIPAFQFLPDLRRFFGGTISQVPDAWDAGNPITYVGRRADLDIGLVHGRSDIVIFPFSTVDLVNALDEAGRKVEPTYVSGADHFDVIDPDAAGSDTADVILGLAD